MRILILTQYYPPETGAAQNRLSDLAKRLTRSGHQVTVLTSLPSYPQGEIYDGYRKRFVMTEEREGVHIVRTWAYVTKKKDFVRRMANYISFALLSLVIGWAKGKKSDVVIVESPPLFLGFSGNLLKRLKQAKFVVNVSDLWPESAVVLGVLQNRHLIRWATWAEEWLYRKTNLVTGQTQGIVTSIRRRCPKKTVELLTNGVSPEFIAAAQQAFCHRESVRCEFGLTKKLVVGFVGLHGLAYALDALLDAARILAHEDAIHFFLIGHGPEKNRLQERAERERLTNVTFGPALPASRMPEIFTAMDLILIPLRNHEMFKGTLPAKLFEAMGAGVPVIGSFKGEAQQIVEKAKCGICVEPENPPEIAAAIMSLFQNPVLRKKMGESGREYACVFYNREEIAKKLEHLLLRANSTAPGMAAEYAHEDK